MTMFFVFIVFIKGGIKFSILSLPCGFLVGTF